MRSRRMPVPVDIVSTPVAKVRSFIEVPNRYQKVRIVWYVHRTITVLLLSFECSCVRLAVFFSECSLRLVLLRMVYSDYVKQRILVYNRCKKNCMEIAQCLLEEGYSVTKVGVAKLLHHYKETGSISRKPGTGQA